MSREVWVPHVKMEQKEKKSSEWKLDKKKGKRMKEKASHCIQGKKYKLLPKVWTKGLESDESFLSLLLILFGSMPIVSNQNI